MNKMLSLDGWKPYTHSTVSSQQQKRLKLKYIEPKDKLNLADKIDSIMESNKRESEPSEDKNKEGRERFYKISQA